ncbi:MAG: hypothetical protein WBQ73_02825 [Candidatus Babeliales bacterium]
MKIINEAFTCGIVALSLGLALEGRGHPGFFLPRSEGCSEVRYNSYRTTKRQQQSYHHALGVGYGYKGSYNNRQTARDLFGGDRWVVSGSRVNHERGCHDIMADYFALPADYESLLLLTPDISRFLCCFYLHGDNLAQDCFPGCYYDIKMPLSHSRWNMGIKETILNEGISDHVAGYMASTVVERDQLAEDFVTALQGMTVFGDMKEPLAYGKLLGRRYETRIADVRIASGYEYVNDECYAAAELVFVVPSGNRPCPEFFFQPIVGNGRHWELGCKLQGSIEWSCNPHDTVRMACEGIFYISHLFRDTQLRSYDLLLRGRGSRYMLLQEMTQSSHDVMIDGTSVDYSYQSRIVPAINITTLETTLTIPVQCEMLLCIRWWCEPMRFTLGYDFWARSAEKVKRRKKVEKLRWALKGDAQLYGFEMGTDTPAPLNVSQSYATLFHGQGVTNFVLGQEFTNVNADSAGLATNSTGQLNNITTDDSGVTGLAQSAVNGSLETILINDADIDQCSGIAARSISHTLFMSCTYLPCYEEENEKFHYYPYFEIGAEVEYPQPLSGPNGAIRQWGVWGSMGLLF